ncbi:hypothetical protein LMG27198_43140 [Methylocystis echinoides]|uniref:Uncharacterized protein n=1 Tax=Methylocystis echinoides TaxID=29468 RepID=A0A9W6GY90_9HYPH|nr:hypothetical protein LMG27198_43140 [Methylocystis echinoides]
MPGGALAALRTHQPDEQAAARRIAGVANNPITAMAAAVRQIVSADRLGILRKAARQIRRN